MIKEFELNKEAKNEILNFIDSNCKQLKQDVIIEYLVDDDYCDSVTSSIFKSRVFLDFYSAIIKHFIDDYLVCVDECEEFTAKIRVSISEIIYDATNRTLTSRY